MRSMEEGASEGGIVDDGGFCSGKRETYVAHARQLILPLAESARSHRPDFAAERLELLEGVVAQVVAGGDVA